MLKAMFSFLSNKNKGALSPVRYKKLISFSLWGDNPLYIEGAFENIKLQESLFPDWICRFYVDKDINTQILQRLKQFPVEIILESRDQEFSGSFWRFQALFDDPTIAMVIVRDVDSRLTRRERNAVAEWIESGLEFHIMRDHPNHTHRIMAGMWGARCDLMKPELINYFRKKYLNFLNSKTLGFWSDTDFLEKVLWPKIIKSHLAHISFPSNIVTKKEKYFSDPLDDKGNFIGNKFDENNVPVYTVESK